MTGPGRGAMLCDDAVGVDARKQGGGVVLGVSVVHRAVDDGGLSRW